MIKTGRIETFETLPKDELSTIKGGTVEDIPVNLRMLRVTKGVTQQEVAKAVKVDVTTISLYESGKRVPSPEVMLDLADYFQATLDDIMRG
jgi:bacteriocin-like protein